MLSVARDEYELQLHAALLRTMLAVLVSEQQRGAEEHPATAVLEAELDAVEARIDQLPDGGRPMRGLAERLGWSDDEVGFMWTAVALAANPRMMVHARALDDGATRGLSTGLYSRIATLDPAAARALGLAFFAASSPARSGLLVRGASDRVAAAVPWWPAPELVRFLAGTPALDRLLVDVRAPAAGLCHDEVQRARLDEIARILGSGEPLVLYVEGPELTGRRTAIAVASRAPVLALDLAQLPATGSALGDALIAHRREAALRGAIPLIAGVEELTAGGGGGGEREPRMRLLAQHLDDAAGPVVLVTSWHGLDVGTRLPAVRIEWPAPDVATRGRLWVALSGAEGDPDGGYERLAVRFRLGAGAIRRAVSSARVLQGAREPGAPLSAPELLAGVRQNIAERMGGLAERVAIKQSWDDLVLADDVMARVRALVGRVQHAHLVFEQWGYRAKMPRGVGVAALFSGAPGTGKTMVAGLIARELDLDLYQVDLSKVVSKWVGETEKQLAKVFDAAEAGHVLLLFDEADALFGQRSSETRGATDRYANLEVNFLLQRIESFNGTVILTTNLEASIDKALKRRLAAHVVFQAPDDDERVRLWQRLLAAEGAPLGRDIDAHKLAMTFPKMTGANIRNAALSAAFLAAAERRPSIDHATVMQAARSEYLSMGHVLANMPGL